MTDSAVVRPRFDRLDRVSLARAADAIVAAIVPELKAGDVVAILSNGGFGGIYEKLPKAIAAAG